MSTVNLAIVGGREFDDYDLLEVETTSYIKEILQKFVNPSEVEVVIVSGGARGADTLAEKYAKTHNYNTLIFRVTPHQWKDLGKLAGIRRNTDIVNNSDYMIAFPDQNSRGTWDSIRKMTKKNNQVKVIKPKQNESTA